MKILSLLLRRLSFFALAVIVTGLSHAIAEEDEWISGEQDLKRRLREKYGDALGEEIILIYHVLPGGSAELAPVKVKKNPPAPQLTEEELQQAQQEYQEREQRWSQKEFTSMLFMATVWDDQFTEFTWYSEGRLFRALFNADVTKVSEWPWIETDTHVFSPLILPNRVKSDSAQTSDTGATGAFEISTFSEEDLALFGAGLEYIVGYDPAAEVGTDADYEALEAIVEAMEVILATPASNQ